jgi:CO/xanthine dehydrogenase FAD-binding subunit
MKDFDYVCARNLAEALALLNEAGRRSRVLAGGTDLLVQARSGPVDFDRVVDVTHVAELKAIEVNGRVTIGAAVTFAQLIEHPALQTHAPLLVQACRQVGSAQVRNAGTLGGNIANAAACADSAPALVCLEAQAIVVTPAGEVRWPVSELITGTHQTKLPPGALIRAFTFELPPAGSRGAFERIGRRRAMAIARLSLAAMGARGADGKIAWVRLVPGAAFARFRRVSAVEDWLRGQTPDAAVFQAAGRGMAEAFIAESGRRWSAEWKEKALAALTERALRQVVGGPDEN